jgi:hypothetical protein
MKKILALVAVAALVAFAAPALAANPFMDVPMNHWAYDAISQLAASGVINGYPDATYKGNQPMTRYEMATIVARALAVVDMTKASKQDVEMLKRLVVEFKDELDALGVKVENIDERLAVMEERLGGWQFWGEFRMDTKIGNNDNVYDDTGAYRNPYGFGGERDVNLNRYRIYMRKYINDTTMFQARIGGSDAVFQRYWVQTQLPWDITLKVGNQYIDWEDELGFYVDNEPFAGDVTRTGFMFSKSWGMADLWFFVGHQDKGATQWTDSSGKTYDATTDATLAALRADFNFNEKFRFGVMAYMDDADDDAYTLTRKDWSDANLYMANFTVNFTPAVAFKGAYYMQDIDWATGAQNYLGQNRDDSPKAYRAIVDVSQEAFGFTSLWLEYAHMDQDYIGDGPDYAGDAAWFTSDMAYDNYGAPLLINRMAGPFDYDETTVMFVRAKQKWNDKWATFQRYVNAEFDAVGKDDTTNMTFGVEYWLNPAVRFELAYDKVDYGTGTNQRYYDDDSLIRLRTHVYF